MKAWQIGVQQGIDSLQCTQRPEPAAGPGEVLIAMRACALNHRDLMIVEGRYGKPRAAERIPLSDGVGEVIASGEGVSGLAPGDRVVATHFTSWSDGPYDPACFAHDLGNSADGLLAERVVLPAAALLKVPAAIGDAVAVGLPVAAVTAWSCLQSFARVRAGDLVLVLGTGGVAIFALQLARMNGARVAITSSSDAKLARARALGAEFTINYRNHPEWHRELLRQTGGRGADIVVETGGFGTLGQSIEAAAPNARIGLIGALAPGGSLPDPRGLLLRNITLKGITSGSRRMLADLVRAVEANGMEPVIDRSFGFDEAREAYRHLQGAGHFGKVVIAIRCRPEEGKAELSPA